MHARMGPMGPRMAQCRVTLSLCHAQMAAVESYSRRQAGVPAEVSAFLKYQPSSVPAELAFESATGILR